MRQAEGTPGCKHRHDGQEARKKQLLDSCHGVQDAADAVAYQDGSYAE